LFRRRCQAAQDRETRNVFEAFAGYREENMRTTTLRCVMAAMLLVEMSCALRKAQSPQEWTWHTEPDKWTEPRAFETPFEDRFADQLTLEHVNLRDEFNLKVRSPNEAYWFGVNIDWPEPPEVSNNGSEFLVSSRDVMIYVYTERPHMIRITVFDHYPNFSVDARWITEKLLYLRVWWGRVLGSSYIIDMENESIIYKEMVQDGLIPFQQWHERSEQ